MQDDQPPAAGGIGDQRLFDGPGHAAVDVHEHRRVIAQVPRQGFGLDVLDVVPALFPQRLGQRVHRFLIVGHDQHAPTGPHPPPAHRARRNRQGQCDQYPTQDRALCRCTHSVCHICLPSLCREGSVSRRGNCPTSCRAGRSCLCRRPCPCGCRSGRCRGSGSRARSRRCRTSPSRDLATRSS